MMETATAGGEAPALTWRERSRLSRRADDRASGLAPATPFWTTRPAQVIELPFPSELVSAHDASLAIGRPRLTRLGYFAATRAFGRSSAAPGSAPSTSTTSSSPAPGRPSASPSTTSAPRRRRDPTADPGSSAGAAQAQPCYTECVNNLARSHPGEQA